LLLLIEGLRNTRNLVYVEKNMIIQIVGTNVNTLHQKIDQLDRKENQRSLIRLIEF